MDDALGVLKSVGAADPKAVLDEIIESMHERFDAVHAKFWTRALWLPITASIALAVFNQLSGINVFRRELYDLAEDIGETNDLAAAHPAKAQELHAQLVQWRDRMQALLPSRANPDYIGPDALRRLFLVPADEAKPRGYWV